MSTEKDRQEWLEFCVVPTLRERIEADWELAFWGDFQVGLSVPVRKATITVEAVRKATA